MANAFLGYDQYIPLLAPVDITTVSTSTYIDLRNAQHASFLIQFGVITDTTATQQIMITIQCCTAPLGTEATVEYRYQKSAAVGTGGATQWGDVTSIAATGVGMHVDADDGFWILATLDLGLLATSDYRYARLVLTPDDTTVEACLVSVMGIIEARYKQDDHISATADASA